MINFEPKTEEEREALREAIRAVNYDVKLLMKMEGYKIK